MRFEVEQEVNEVELYGSAIFGASLSLSRSDFHPLL
jgi:hypothetical protein